MWKLTIEDDQANKTVVHLVRDQYALGRAEENAVRLTERNISRRHALLERQEDAWVVRDLSSYNGTYVNGQRVATAQQLAHGDLLQIGDYRISLDDESLRNSVTDVTATVPAPRHITAGAAVDRFVVLVGPTPGAEIALGTGRMLIGRGEDCDISINHASVSRVHAELHAVGEGRYEIIDKGSANGVRINGVELPRSFIDARDVIELGDVIVKFIPRGQTYVPAADESLQIAAIGAARRQEAEEGLVHGLKSSMGLRIGLGIGLALFAALVVIALVGRQSATTELVSIKDEVTARAERTLADAKGLLGRGDPRAAYEKAAEIPAGAAARDSNDFRAIQAAYADALFQQAEQTSDPADKRALYDRIASSPTIDRARRSRAAEELAKLSAQGVDVNELPSTPVAPAPAASAPTHVASPVSSAATAAPAEATPKPSAPVVTTKSSPRSAPSHAPASTAKNTPASGANSNTTLVRDTPF